MQSISEFVRNGSIWKPEDEDGMHDCDNDMTEVQILPCPYFVREEAKRYCIVCSACVENAEELHLGFRTTAAEKEYKAKCCDTGAQTCLVRKFLEEGK